MSEQTTTGLGDDKTAEDALSAWSLGRDKTLIDKLTHLSPGPDEGVLLDSTEFDDLMRLAELGIEKLDGDKTTEEYEKLENDKRFKEYEYRIAQVGEYEQQIKELEERVVRQEAIIEQAQGLLGRIVTSETAVVVPVKDIETFLVKTKKPGQKID